MPINSQQIAMVELGDIVSNQNLMERKKNELTDLVI